MKDGLRVIEPDGGTEPRTRGTEPVRVHDPRRRRRPGSEPGGDRVHAEPVVPKGFASAPSTGTRAAWAIAFLAPPLAALVVSAWGDGRGGERVLAMTLVVVVVAALGRTLPGVVAALVAWVAAAIVRAGSPEGWSVSGEEMLVLVGWLSVAAITGWLATSAQRWHACAEGRRRELHEIVGYVDSVSSVHGDDRVEVLAELACRRLETVLGLRSCRWNPDGEGCRGRRDVLDGPILFTDGTLQAPLRVLGPDRGELPQGIEMPAVAGTCCVGHFILDPDPAVSVSREERRIAGAIVTLFADAAARPRRPGSAPQERRAR